MEPLFDNRARLAFRRRAHRRGSRHPAAGGGLEPHGLLTEAAEGLAERLLDVRSNLGDCALIGDLQGAMSARLQDHTGTKITRPYRLETHPTLLESSPELSPELSPESPESPWRNLVVDLDHLPLRAGALDCVVSFMLLSQLNDPLGFLIQTRMALRPRGLYFGVCLGGESLQPFREAFRRAEMDLKGGLAARLEPGLTLQALVQLTLRAGLKEVVCDRQTCVVSYANCPQLLSDLRALGLQNALQARPRHLSPRALFDRLENELQPVLEREALGFELLFWHGLA